MFYLSLFYLLSQSFPFLDEIFRVLAQSCLLFWVEPSLFWFSHSYLMNQSFPFFLDGPSVFDSAVVSAVVLSFLSRIFSILTKRFPFNGSVVPIFFPCALLIFAGSVFWFHHDVHCKIIICTGIVYCTNMNE